MKPWVAQILHDMIESNPGAQLTHRATLDALRTVANMKENRNDEPRIRKSSS